MQASSLEYKPFESKPFLDRIAPNGPLKDVVLLFYAASTVLAVVHLFAITHLLSAWGTMKEIGAIPAYSWEMPALAETWRGQETSLTNLQGALNVLLFVWFLTVILLVYRGTRTISEVIHHERRWSTKWAAGAWFVPVLNLFVPFQVMKENDEMISMALEEDKNQNSDTAGTQLSPAFWFYLRWFAIAALAIGEGTTLPRFTNPTTQAWDSAVNQMYGWTLAAFCISLLSILLACLYFGSFVTRATRVSNSWSYQPPAEQQEFDPVVKSQVATAVPRSQIGRRLEELMSLRDQGLISETELQTQRTRILDEL